MSTRRIGRILPPNAVPLELDTLQGGNVFPRLRQSVPGIYLSKLVTLPDSFLPWLIEEYGLEPLVRIFGGDQRRAIREGIPFSRKIGTLWAVRTSLRWAGHELATVEEEPLGAHWFQFQLGLEKPPDHLVDLENVIAAAEFSKGYTRKLARIFAGYDVRPFLLDGSLLDDEGLLSDYSGRQVREDWPVLSFGRKDSFIAKLFDVKPPEQRWQVNQYHSDLAYYTDRFLLDHGRLDEDSTVLNNIFDISVLQSYAISADFGPSPAPSTYTFCKAMVIPSEQHKFGDLNHTFARRKLVEEGDYLRFDEDKIDVAGVRSYYVPIDELTENLITDTVQTNLAVDVQFRNESTYSYIANENLGTMLDRDFVDGPETIVGRELHRTDYQDFTMQFGAVEIWPVTPWPLDNRPWQLPDVLIFSDLKTETPEAQAMRTDEDGLDGWP